MCCSRAFWHPGDHVLGFLHGTQRGDAPPAAAGGPRRPVYPGALPPGRNVGPAALETCLEETTRAVVMTHASNVCGTLLPIAEVGAFCRTHGLRFFVDSAQTAGVWPIDMETMGIDAVAFTGHKGLLGPQGIGGFVLGPDLASQIEPLIAGGTGQSQSYGTDAVVLPDRFEAGTLNLPGNPGTEGWPCLAAGDGDGPDSCP